MIKRLLGTKATSFLIECIFDKFKETVEEQHDLTASEVVGLNLNTKTSESTYLRATLLKSFKQLKSICNKTAHSQAAPFSGPLDDSNDVRGVVEELYDIAAEDETEKSALLFRTKSSLIVLNYATIFWCLLLLVVAVLFFSVLFALFIIKVQRRRGDQAAFCVKIASMFTKRPELNDDESANSRRIYNVHKRKYLLDNPKLRPQAKAKAKQNQTTADTNEASASLRSSSIESCSTKVFDETTSSSSGYFHSHIWEKDFFQLKSTTTATDPTSMDDGTTKTPLPVYDLFLVYNKSDKDLIETVIGPVLKGRPYNYKIALQHDTQTSRGGDSSKATSQELVAWRHSTSRGNYYNLNLVEQFVDIINASSFVLFVLSKSLFTELEYRLCIETPKHKRLVLLADDIHDSIADSLLAPAQIFRGNFNFDFEQCKKGNRFGFNAEAEKSLLEADPLTMKSSRLLKLSNSLSNHSLNRNKISQNVRNQRLFN